MKKKGRMEITLDNFLNFGPTMVEGKENFATLEAPELQNVYFSTFLHHFLHITL